MMKKLPSLYIGAVSNSVLRVVNEHFSQYVGILISQNQSNYNGGGYIKLNPKEIKSVYPNVLLCRDHGYGGTIKEDFKYCDLIHLDPFKDGYKNFDRVSEIYNNYAKLNPEFDNWEVGTEDDVLDYLPSQLDYLLSKLSKPPVYAVVQGGNKIINGKNAGVFEETRYKAMIDVCKKHGVRSKEHNGDWLTGEEIRKRFELGLDAINMAPYFGWIESSLIVNELNNNEVDFYHRMILDDGNYKRWVSEDFDIYNEKRKLIKIAGHYLFESDFVKFLKNHRYKNLQEDINKVIFNVISAFLVVIDDAKR